MIITSKNRLLSFHANKDTGIPSFKIENLQIIADKIAYPSRLVKKPIANNKLNPITKI